MLIAHALLAISAARAQVHFALLALLVTPESRQHKVEFPQQLHLKAVNTDLCQKEYSMFFMEFVCSKIVCSCAIKMHIKNAENGKLQTLPTTRVEHFRLARKAIKATTQTFWRPNGARRRLNVSSLKFSGRLLHMAQTSAVSTRS